MKLLTTAEVAELLRLCPQSVRELCEQSRLKFIRHSPKGKMLILEESIEPVRNALLHTTAMNRMKFLQEMRTERAVLAKARRKSERAAEKRLAQVKPHSAIAKSFRRNAEKQMRQKQIDRFAMGQTKLALKRFNSTCLDHAMPPVPAPKHRAADVGNMFPFPGVYFAWDGLLCSYVGESENVPNRVRSHNKFGKSTWCHLSKRTNTSDTSTSISGCSIHTTMEA